jgi:hypothetical protein
MAGRIRRRPYGHSPARPEDWNGQLERQIELQNSEFLLTVKDDLERLKLERSRLVSERDAVDGIGFSSQKAAGDSEKNIAGRKSNSGNARRQEQK